MSIDLFSQSLAIYIRAYKEGKSRPFDISACILVEKKKSQVYNNQISSFQLLYACVYIYTDAFGVTKEEVWKVYYDPPKHRLLNAISSISGLTMHIQRKVSEIDAYVLIDTTASHCYLSSSYATRIGLYVLESNNSIVLGNGLKLKLEGTINVHVRIRQYQSQVLGMVT